MHKRYMVYYKTIAVGRTYCGRNLTFERAQRLFDQLVAKYSDSDSFIEAGVHLNSKEHINALYYRA